MGTLLRVLLLGVVAALAFAGAGWGQGCNGAITATYVVSGTPTRSVSKVFHFMPGTTGTLLCSAGAAINGAQVVFNPPISVVGGPSDTTRFICGRNTLTAPTSASCSWVCNCVTVSIGPSDGLPVELMEFSVESGDDEDSESAEAAEDGDG